MNAPVKVFFPDHSTLIRSFAVAAFVIRGPFGAIMGGKLAYQRGQLVSVDWYLDTSIGRLLTCCVYDLENQPFQLWTATIGFPLFW